MIRDINCTHQNDRYVSICRKEAYKIITTTEDTSLQLRHKFIIFTAPYSCQPSQVAIGEAQKNIRKLQEMVGQLRKLFDRINEFHTNQKTMETLKHIYTTVSKKYLTYIK
jgi:hypothetical protein